MSKEEIAKKLKKARENKKMKQEDVAAYLGTTTQKVSSFETGRTRVDVDTLARLCELYDVDVNYIIGIEQPEWQPSITPRDLKEINNIIANARDLLHQDGLMFDGKPATDEDVESILSAMEIGLEMAKKKSKEKFTPKKYKEK